MRRTLTLLTVFALLIGVLAIPATAIDELGTPTYTEQWDGRGTDSERCDLVGEEGRPEEGWIHWIFNTKGDSTDARLTLGGTGSGTYPPGPPLNAEVWHFYTPYFELTGLTATIFLYGGLPGDGGGLVISDYCPGLRGEITITKTAVPSYTRTHEWDIEKSVETEAGYEHEELPKVWLYTDGSGDETATWTVDVTYEGYEDTGHALSGSVIIENTGNLDANITNLVDTYGGAPVIFDCKVDGVPFVFGQTLLEPEEVLVCTYEVDPADKELLENTVRVGGTFSDGTTFNETDTATYNWDTPTTEVNKTVNVKDISDLFGEVDLGTVTAPNGDTFTYTKDFAWEDYGQEECGDHRYDNTATIVETGQEADASLLVNVQCFVFEGETAWAATGDVPLFLRYVPRGNWATYVEYFGEEKDTTLFAGQTIDVGSVNFSDPDEGFVTITVTLTGDWEFEDVAENLKVQDYAEAPSGNPEPGLFAHKKDCDAEESSCAIVVPENDYYGVHVNVGQWIPDPDFGP